MSEKGRVFLRGITSENYGLTEFRADQLEAPRVRNKETVVDDSSGIGHSHHGSKKETKGWWRIGPGDDPFLTQTLQVHFVEIPPGKSNIGHGHQNEAAFYILQGSGYEIHDGQRYDWAKDDFVIVHTDSVHRHFNDGDEPALAIIVKAKAMWMFFGLIQQGKIGTGPDDAAYSDREDWSRLWTPGVEDRRKVVKSAETEWIWTPDGRIRTLSSPSQTDVRLFSVDAYQQEVPAGSRSGKHWHMADEVVYVMSGSGYSLHWDVQAEIDDRFYARIAREPTRHEINAGDTLYIPQNTVHQHFNSSNDEPLVFLSAQNRLFRYLGYDNTVVLEDAPEYGAH